MKQMLMEAAGVFVLVVFIAFVRMPRTHYPPHYSEENFSLIKIGTSEEEVTRLIGSPEYVPDGYYWQYTRPGSSILPTYHWSARSLIISNGVVVEIIKGDAIL